MRRQRYELYWGVPEITPRDSREEYRLGFSSLLCTAGEALGSVATASQILTRRVTVPQVTLRSAKPAVELLHQSSVCSACPIFIRLLRRAPASCCLRLQATDQEDRPANAGRAGCGGRPPDGQQPVHRRDYWRAPRSAGHWQALQHRSLRAGLQSGSGRPVCTSGASPMRIYLAAFCPRSQGHAAALRGVRSVCELQRRKFGSIDSRD